MKREPGARSRSHAMRAAALVLALAPLMPRVEAGEAEPFHPGSHLEPGSLARLWVADAAHLREALGATDVGRVLGSPDWRHALRGAWAFAEGPLKRLDVAWREWSGRSLAQVTRLPRGALVLDLDAPAAGSSPLRLSWTAALELRGARREILEVVSGVMRRLAERTGLEASARAVPGTDIVVRTHPVARLHVAEVGAYLIVSSSPARIEAAALAHADSQRRVGRDAVEGDASGVDPAAARGPSWSPPARVSVACTQAVARIRLPPLLEWLARAFTALEPRDLNAIVTACGIDGLEALWVAVGRRDRSVETAWSLEARGGARGLVEVLQRGCGRLVDASSVLALVPIEAGRIQGIRLRAGSFLRGLDRWVRQSVPEIGTHLDATYRDLEAVSGVSVARDLFELGDVSAYSFDVSPPGGGALLDRILLVRREELGPYWRVLEKMVARRGLAWLSVPAPSASEREAAVRYVLTGSADRGVRLEEGAPALSVFPAVWCSTALSAALPAVARLDRPGGWAALSIAPQALVRYREFHSRGAMLTADREVAALVLEAFEGSSAAIVLREGEAPARATAALLRRLRTLTPALTRSGADVDLATLAPSRAATWSEAPARARLEWGAAGWTVRTDGILPSALVTAFAAITAFTSPDIPGP